MSEAGGWRRCSACKKFIPYGATYYVCNVSTCNRPRTGLVFCTVTCWEVHLPEANHRETWALERKAPRNAAEAASAGGGVRASAPAGEAATETGEERSGQRRLVRPATPSRHAPPREVLIVASRLKEYIRVRSGGFNTSDRVLEPLSEIVRALCDEAILRAEREGRRTVLDRDVPTR